VLARKLQDRQQAEFGDGKITETNRDDLQG
jgi:hypothetical protein